MCVTNNLKELRKSKNIRQQDLADATGYNRRTISRIERNEADPSAEVMLRMAAYFGVLVEDVFRIEDMVN